MTAFYLSDLPGSHLERVLKRIPLAILPLGSTEYHGPHAAFGTDFFIAQETARRVGEALEALVLPAIPFSACPAPTRTYPGTLDVPERIYTHYLEGLLASVLRLGVPGVLALNAHDGNVRPLAEVGDRLMEQFPGKFFLVANWWDALPTELVETLGFFSQDGGHGHGGPLEISSAGSIRPDTIDITQARDLDVVQPPGGGVVRAISEGRPLPNWQGYHGRATEISIEKGKRLMDLAVENIITQTRAWLHELSRSG